MTPSWSSFTSTLELGRRLALHHATELKLDRTSYDNQPANETPRHYELDCF